MKLVRNKKHFLLKIFYLNHLNRHITNMFDKTRSSVFSSTRWGIEYEIESHAYDSHYHSDHKCPKCPLFHMCKFFNEEIFLFIKEFYFSLFHFHVSTKLLEDRQPQQAALSKQPRFECKYKAVRLACSSQSESMRSQQRA